MSDIVTHECTVCGEEFEVHTDANAADTGTCSPDCETDRLSS